MGIKKLITNSGTSAYLLHGKLSNSTITPFNNRKVVDNRSFWKYIKPLFSDKSSNSNKITLVEKDLILEKNDDIAETFNDFFTSAISNLNIPRYQDPLLIVTKPRTKLNTRFEG